MNITTDRMYLILVTTAEELTKVAHDVIATESNISDEGHQTLCTAINGAGEALATVRNLMDKSDCPYHEDESHEADALLIRVIRVQNGLNCARNVIASDLHYVAQDDLIETIGQFAAIREALGFRVQYTLPDAER